jgi:hypothetical protein
MYAGKNVTGQFTDPSGGYPDAQLHFGSDGKLAFAPQSLTSSRKHAATSHFTEMCQFCPTLRSDAPFATGLSHSRIYPEDNVRAILLSRA